jgi:hypothetical protein
MFRPGKFCLGRLSVAGRDGDIRLIIDLGR